MGSGKPPPPPVILIVEDDELLRICNVDIIEEAGFIAIEAANADEALTILESRRDIAALVTDIQMPGSMDGLKLAHAVRDRWPPIKILVVSGQYQLAQNNLPPDSIFLGKPFQAEKLVSRLRTLVAGA